MKYLTLVVMLLLSACATHQPLSIATSPTGKCDQKFNYSIQFDRFDETAQQIAHATGCGIQTDLSQTAAIKPQPVNGYMTPREAVQKAIQGTSLKIVEQQPDVIMVQ